jgi:hypothetical protein
MCLQPAERDLATPEGIKKYRKSFKEQCGVTIVLILLRRCIQASSGSHSPLLPSPTECQPKKAKEPAIFSEQATRKESALLSKIFKNATNTIPSKGTHSTYQENLSLALSIGNTASQSKQIKKSSGLDLQLRPISGE